MQTAARQLFARKQPEALKDYYVGEKLAVMNRASLVQVADGILQRLTDAELPGITPETVAALQTQCDGYVQANTDQLGAVAASKAHREAAARHLKAATDLRIEVQYAADAAYPFDKPTSAPIRTEFALPINRRFTTP